MTLQHHPDCDHCNRPQGPFTPSQFAEHFGYAPSNKERIEPSPEVIAAGAEVDRLVEMYDDITRVWFKARQQITSLDPRSPKHRDAAEVERTAFNERDRLDDELRKARADYHRLHTQHLNDRRHQEQLEAEAAQQAERDAATEQTRSKFKQLIGRDKETK